VLSLKTLPLGNRKMLKPTLTAQYIWVFLGLSYNLISAIKLSNNFAPLAPTDPFAGIAFIVLCALIIGLGFSRFLKTYAVLISLHACLLTYSGICLHIAAYVFDPTLPGYLSPVTWALAILINIFGVTALLSGAFSAFHAKNAA
jgi:hypothetical protein